MGLRNSVPVLKYEEQSSVTENRERYSVDDINDLNWAVHQLDTLELKISNEPQYYKLLLVISQSENDLEVAFVTPDRDDPEHVVFCTAWLRKAFTDADCRVGIYNETNRSTNTLKAYDAMDSIMFRAIGQFRDNETVERVISSLVEEFPQFGGESEEDNKSLLTELVGEALKLLIGLASQGFKDQAEKNKESLGNWFDKNCIIDESELGAGDRLEFSRLFYNHWGIFLGKLGGKLLVLHFSTAGRGKKYSMKKSASRGSSARDKPAYRIDSIQEPLGNRRMRINNRLDRNYRPLKSDEMIQGIVERLTSQSSPEYSVFRNNCEHLVNELRYKEHRCEQLPPILGPLTVRVKRVLGQS